MNRKETANILLVIFSLTVTLHILVLIGIVPADMVWGGRLESGPQLYMMELISILLNVFLIYIVLQKANYTRRSISRKWLGYWLKGFSGLFLLNTLGNLFAIQPYERIAGTIITALCAFFCWRLSQARSIEKRRNML